MGEEEMMFRRSDEVLEEAGSEVCCDLIVSEAPANATGASSVPLYVCASWNEPRGYHSSIDESHPVFRKER
jgi:hypothetical protein